MMDGQTMTHSGLMVHMIEGLIGAAVNTSLSSMHHLSNYLHRQEESSLLVKLKNRKCTANYFMSPVMSFENIN